VAKSAIAISLFAATAYLSVENNVRSSAVATVMLAGCGKKFEI